MDEVSALAVPYPALATTLSSYGSYVVRKETAYGVFSQYLSCLISSRLLLEVMFLSVMHLDNCSFCYVVSHIWRSNITAFKYYKTDPLHDSYGVTRPLHGRRKISWMLLCCDVVYIPWLFILFSQQQIDFLYFVTTCLVAVESIQWVRPDGILVAYIQKNEDDEEEECPFILLTKNGDFAMVRAYLRMKGYFFF